MARSMSQNDVILVILKTTMEEKMNTEGKFMNVDDLASYLGVSRNTVYWWIAKRRIPHNKVGKLVRFDREKVAAWLQRNSREAVI